MVNKQIELDGVIIPYITNDEGMDYYPIRYVLEQFLLKSASPLHNKDGFKLYIERYKVDYTFKGTVSQETYCMNRDGWEEYFKIGKKNKNKTNDKIKRMKLWCEYLNIEYKDTTKKEYDLYTLKCIEEFRKKSPKVKTKTCVRCEREFPNSKYFYIQDARIKGKTLNTCRECTGGNWLNDNKEQEYIYREFGLSGFEEYLNNSESFYMKYAINSDGDINKYLNLNKIHNEQLQKKIILNVSKKLYDEGKISSKELSVEKIKELSNIKLFGWSKINNNELMEYCTNNDCKLRYWAYPKYKINNMTFDEAKNIMNTYLLENNIVIEDILGYKDYYNIFKKCRILSFVSNNRRDGESLEFLVKYYDYKYPAYKFSLRSNNYYKKKENMIFDIRYLIENDLKIEPIKTPLYITKNYLAKNANNIYYALRNNGYYNSIFDLVNDAYPNMFIEADFNNNPYRSKFDSLEEAQVDEQLRLRFKGVIYNPREESDRVEFDGMIPDWIIPTHKGCYLVEYYGLWQEKESKTSHRLQRYKKTHDSKLIKYNKLKDVGYKHLGIYPNDLKNNFEGLHKKIDKILK